MRCHRTLLRAIPLALALLACAARGAWAQDPDADPDDTSAKIEQFFREGVDLFRSGTYDKAQEKFRQVLELDPSAAEAWRLVRMAGDLALIQMMTDPHMGREPRVIWELYKLHQDRLKRKPNRIQGFVEIAIDPQRHPTERWKKMTELAQVGQFTIPFLVDALGNARDHEVRTLARVTATRMGPRAALPLIELLKYGHESGSDDARARYIRENAALILGDLNDKRALAALKRVAEDEEEPPVVRKFALMSMQKITGLDIDALRSATDYYYLQADRYVRELAGVADEARDADGVVWQLKDGKLVDYQVPRFAWNELMAEQACYDCMAIDPKYEDIYPLFAEVVASQIAEVWELLDIATERRTGRPFTDEEVTDVRTRETKLMVEDLMLDSQGRIYVSTAALEVPRVPVRRNLLLSGLGPVYVYRAIDKCLDDAQQDERELPKLAACHLTELAYALDYDGALLPGAGAGAQAPGARKDRKGRAPKPGAGRGRGEGAALVRALRFPDERVQYHAAIALARMNPPQPFDGAGEVVAVLARAIGESGPLQVLVVEEDPGIRNEIKGKLQDLDIGVTIAQSAREGLARATGFPPFDAVLVSPNLEKEESSAWLIDGMMADPRSRVLPAAIITDYNRRDEHRAAFKAHENVKGYVPVEDGGKELRELITKIASQRATPIMSKKRSEDLSVLAAETLCQIDPHLARINRMRTEDAADACVGALVNRIDRIRRPCIDALGRFKIAKAHDKLLTMAFDPMQSADIRVAAARAVSLITPEVNLGRLLEMADNEEEEYILRYLTAEAFGHGNATPEKLKEFLKALRLPLEDKRAMQEDEGF